MVIYLILIGYLILVFVGSLRGASKINSTAEGYFLANRDLGTLSLFFTILATNFSAFYFLGFAGEGYRTGYTYYVVMAFGTGFACLSFFLIGTKTWALGKAKSYITPAELIKGETGSQFLGNVFAVVMLLFTFPYLALQIVGAGYILEQLTKGAIPYLGGAFLLTSFTIVYVWAGGMRSVARTDLKQGLLVIGMMLAALVWISQSLGGFVQANQAVMDLVPGLFTREGANEFYTGPKWFSLLIFWLFCIPMFPQIFMRFYAARNLDHLKRSAWLYGAVPFVISLFPIVIGVLGHLDFPDLSPREADRILPMMLIEYTPDWFGALVMTGALAAFMSTLDSQLLALSTMAMRDFQMPLSGKIFSMERQVTYGRWWVILFAVVGLLIAARPFDTIFDMGKLAFAGLSILFPVALFVLRFGPVNTRLAIGLIITGEALLLALYYNLLPDEWLLGFEPAVVIVILIMAIMAGYKGLVRHKLS